MANNKLQDIIIPELFAPYVIMRTKELSALINSGAAQSNTMIDTNISNGVKHFKVSYDKHASITIPVLVRGKAWTATELADAIDSDAPMTNIGEIIAKWWNIQEQKIMAAILSGVFGGTLQTTHRHDISGKKGAAAVISAGAVLDTKQLLGDASTGVRAIAMHPAVFTVLQKQNLVEYIPNSEGVVEFPAYLGYKVLIDDGILPAAGGIYSTYLFGDGVFGRGDGVPDALTPIELGRDILASDDILVSRRALCLHPLGISWTNPVIAAATPSNSDLADPANWQKVVPKGNHTELVPSPFPSKSIGMAVLRHKIQ